MSSEASFKRVAQALNRYGLLLETDPKLPSVTAIVAGAPIAGSWWGHPKGHEIFRVSQRLADQPDVAGAKLVSGKATWIAKRLWPALVSIGSAREAWHRVQRKRPITVALTPSRELFSRLCIRYELVVGLSAAFRGEKVIIPAPPAFRVTAADARA